MSELNEAELVEYHRLTALIADVELRRTSIALLHHGLRRNPVRLALLDERESQLHATGAALIGIRAPLYGRFRWPAIYSGREGASSQATLARIC